MNDHSTAPAVAHPCANSIPETCTYISIRPTFGVGDYTASASIAEYDEVQLEIGLPDTPTQAHEIFKRAEDAIDTALAIKAQRPHLHLWYNGHEDLAEFSDWRSLARAFAEWNEDWDVVEQVATGVLAHDAPAVLEGADYIPLIAVAAAKVVL
jgi:hypothetical protein